MQVNVSRQKFQSHMRLFLVAKDKMFKYQFNMEKGQFLNKPLFDRTVGIKRKV